jgi:hypothetical protein
MTQKNRPVKEVRVGSIKAAIWANASFSRYHATYLKIYKTNDGGWKQTTSFAAEDATSLVEAIVRASSWITWQIYADINKELLLKQEGQPASPVTG